ncbi:MAG: hypothetical protein WC302_03300 [Candidatus Paceibacterota bacterium]|jgi:hypothetical protein
MKDPKDLKVIDLGYHIGAFAKDAEGNVFYTFEDEFAEAEDWHNAEDDAPDADSFASDEIGELFLKAWQAIVELVKAMKV